MFCYCVLCADAHFVVLLRCLLTNLFRSTLRTEPVLARVLQLDAIIFSHFVLQKYRS